MRNACACSHGVSWGLRRCVGAAAPHTSVAAAEVSDCELRVLVLRQLLERLQRTRSARRVLLAERLCTAPREGGVLRSEAVRESGRRGLAFAVDATCRTERRAHARLRTETRRPGTRAAHKRAHRSINQPRHTLCSPRSLYVPDGARSDTHKHGRVGVHPCNGAGLCACTQAGWMDGWMSSCHRAHCVTVLRWWAARWARRCVRACMLARFGGSANNNNNNYTNYTNYTNNNNNNNNMIIIIGGGRDSHRLPCTTCG